MAERENKAVVSPLKIASPKGYPLIVDFYVVLTELGLNFLEQIVVFPKYP